jgi:hypothetical protein
LILFGGLLPDDEEFQLEDCGILVWYIANVITTNTLSKSQRNISQI